MWTGLKYASNIECKLADNFLLLSAPEGRNLTMYCLTFCNPNEWIFVFLWAAASVSLVNCQQPQYGNITTESLSIASKILNTWYSKHLQNPFFVLQVLFHFPIFIASPQIKTDFFPCRRHKILPDILTPPQDHVRFPHRNWVQVIFSIPMMPKKKNVPAVLKSPCQWEEVVN